MIKEITMPAGGQTTDTSTIGTWLVKKGDKIKRGDALLEIETDKATLTVESFAKGTVLALLAEPGDSLPAGTVIAYVGDENDMAEVEAKLNAGSEAEENAAAQTKVSVDKEDEYQPIDKSAAIRYAGKPESKEEVRTETKKVVFGDIKAMPNAKKIARENGISLVDVASFVGKDILKRQDVLTYLEQKDDKKAEETKTDSNDTIIPHTTMRKVIARRMLESTQNIPVFTATVEVNMEQCIAFRKLVNSGKEINVSYNDILFKCVEATIRRYPYINSSFTEEATIVHSDVNIGLAVSIDAGLVVPVVKNVEKKNILQISEENKDHVVKARSGKLSQVEMSGGTITVSNLGMYPIKQFTAIINPPEVCILALGAIEDKPVFANGEWKTIPVMNITGSFDHRLIDGAYAAQFLTELKKIIENPALALL